MGLFDAFGAMPFNLINLLAYPRPQINGPGYGKGRNKRPRTFTGAAAAKRAAIKRKNVARHEHNLRRARA